MLIHLEIWVDLHFNLKRSLFFCTEENLNKPISMEKMENVIQNLSPKISPVSRIMICYLSERVSHLFWPLSPARMRVQSFLMIHSGQILKTITFNWHQINKPVKDHKFFVLVSTFSSVWEYRVHTGLFHICILSIYLRTLKHRK